MLPKIIVISGVKEGKRTLCRSIWHSSSKDFKVNDVIPGRGVFKYSVEILPSVIYSLKEDWMNEKSNLEQVKTADTIIYMVSAISFGYSDEVDFLSLLRKKNKTARIILVVNKLDVCVSSEEKKQGKIEAILKLQTTIRKAFSSMDPDDIVMVSATKIWNISSLKECIWDNIIDKTNDEIFDKTLPTIVISGKRGCGKSSTLNQLFGLDLEINKAVACTKYPRVMRVTYEYNGRDYSANVVDLPGIAESIEADNSYAKFYEKYIQVATILLCLSQADTRAYLQDEVFYKKMIGNRKLNKNVSIIMGVNQMDLLFKTIDNPDGINLTEMESDSEIYRTKISDFYSNYSRFFKKITDIKEENVIGFSAIQSWHIDLLKERISNILKK